MSLNSFSKRMPAGIAGAVTRAEHSTIEPQIITPAGTTGAPLTYGVPVQIDSTSGQARLLAAGDTDAYGALVRPYPLSNTNTTDGLGAATPPTAGVCDVLVRGYMTVTLNGATAAKKAGTVYVRLAAPAAGKPIGGIEAAADGGNTVALPDKWYFTGPADTSGNVEIAINI